MGNANTTIPSSTDSLTPAMKQYVEQKQVVGDAVLLFRMGDFYETFYDDAKLVAKVLGIALTARNKDKNPIPLAGIPYHALDSYLHKLVAAGYRVAISEQLEDPKLAKGVVKRDVVRIITPGTLTEDTLLDEKTDNSLASVYIQGDHIGIAVVELASGRFMVCDLPTREAIDELVRIHPAELLVQDSEIDRKHPLADDLHTLCGSAIVRRSPHEFSEFNAEGTLLEHFGVKTLAGFGFDRMRPSLQAAGAVLMYLRETQKTTLGHIARIQEHFVTNTLRIDFNSFRALEIERTLRDGIREGSLLHAMDRTIHPGGTRLLRRWLCEPLVDAGQIIGRQDAVSAFVADERARGEVRSFLRELADVERIAARVALLRANPRDLAGLRRTLRELPELRQTLEGFSQDLIVQASEALGGQDELTQLLEEAIHPEPPFTVREGGMIAVGYNEELDRLRNIEKNGQAWLAEYQKKQVEETGISSLKVGFNKVFGYYIEISNAYRDEVPVQYVRKQTLKNAERYITDELKQYESEILTAADRANDIEFRLFEEIVKQVAQQLTGLQQVAEAIARIDVLSSLAELAEQQNYVRPELIEEVCLHIQDGRHPVLDQMLRDRFVPNDCILDGKDARLLIITGPNMAGKSTFIRQTALLVLMAQVGSFVPASAMSFSPADRIFARVGASDELSRGQSTFMVEMTEAANILNNATERSVVVLDEIGRGTSTFDGLSLAWAITEHLANRTKARALVATHYHELTELSELLAGVKNYNVAVKEWPGGDGGEDSIVFLHKIVPGGTDKSYGIHVARLAGVPKDVVSRSRAVLEELERSFVKESHTTNLADSRSRKQRGQMLLFGEPEVIIQPCERCGFDPEHPEYTEKPSNPIADEISKLDLNNMTPMQAMQILSDLRSKYSV